MFTLVPGVYIVSLPRDFHHPTWSPVGKALGHSTVPSLARGVSSMLAEGQAVFEAGVSLHTMSLSSLGE